MKKINWYYNRLKAMSPAEIPYRFIQLSKSTMGDGSIVKILRF